MNLAILMRHPDNDTTINTLFVRNTDDPRIIDGGRRAMRTAAGVAVTIDLKVNEIERYDMNIVAGMVNVMKEHDCSDLILGMHRKSTIVDSFFGNVIAQLLQTCNRMIIMSRCFVPVDTVERLMVVVPTNAEYETGFRRWVERIGNLAIQISAPIVFIANPETSRYIQGVLAAGEYAVSTHYRDMLSWDDFITHSADIATDDLMILIAARRSSLSFSTDLENMPGHLQRYYAAHNLLLIYPEQFGNEEGMPMPIDVLSHVVETTPTMKWLSWRWLLSLWWRKNK